MEAKDVSPEIAVYLRELICGVVAEGAADAEKKAERHKWDEREFAEHCGL